MKEWNNFCQEVEMREVNNNMEQAFRRVRLLAGIPIKIKVNRGRNKIERFGGKIENVYPKIFTVRKTDGDLDTFSYSDVVAGNVKFFKGE